MIYPKNFESKIGFDQIRNLLKSHCLCTLGTEMVEKMKFSTDADSVREWLQQIAEFKTIQEQAEAMPLQFFFDLREPVSRLRLEGTHLEENELFDLRRSLDTIGAIVRYLTPELYPTLAKMAEEVTEFPQIVKRIDEIIDKFGRMKDNASTELARIRKDLARTENSISHTLYNILKVAQSDGLVDKDVSPTLRDGRLVIPVAPTLKRRIRGIVHDESATGKTVFIEPAEVVEANNKVRELEAEERREIIRILTIMANELRPHIGDILYAYHFLAKIDLVRAKTELARQIQALEPQVLDRTHLDWIQAKHPLLQLALEKQGKTVVPLDITLTQEKRMLIISGPNAGGKSVCLKTVGLLQYMLQCGLSIPVSERSTAGIFNDIMIDIGDEQSIADDLSTYSGHLMNMKQMMKQASGETLLLIDEFGGGTEPTIGGAIAESVLKQFCRKKAFGIITTHYQNLKLFADSHPEVANGAMLYDRHEMKALFQLAIGQPGSSFAIEIARKTGIPEEVIKDASEIIGSDYIQSDKYLQDIVRDKRYWEGKRQTIHQREKQLEERIAHYEEEIKELQQSRRDILRHAKEQAQELLSESNRKIENAIKEIRESQAEKEETKRIREDLNAFKDEVDDLDTKANDELIAKKMKQIQERKERKEKRKQEAKNQPKKTETKPSAPKKDEPLTAGETVRIKGLTTIGRIEAIDGKQATVIFGDMRTKMRADRLERALPQKQEQSRQPSTASRMTRETIDQRKLNFKQDIDIRGMRAEEALNAVMYFIDDAILVGMSRVRILHGTGTGALRQTVREYLASVPNVSHYRDEHVQFGGAGITVVEIG